MAATKPVLRPQRNVVIVGVSFIAIMIAIVVIGVVVFGSLQRQFETFAEEDSPALNHVLNIDRDLFRAQHIITTVMALDDADGRIAAVEEFRSLVAATEDRWRSYVIVAQHGELEIAFQRTYISLRAEWIDATSVLAGYAIEGRSGTDLDVTDKIASCEELFGSLEDALHMIEEQVYEPLIDHGVEAPPLDPRVLLVILLGGGVALGSVAWAFALSLDPPFVDWWTLFGFNTGGGPCRAWCVGAGACRGSGWWVVGGLSTAGLSGVRQVLV